MADSPQDIGVISVRHVFQAAVRRCAEQARIQVRRAHLSSTDQAEQRALVPNQGDHEATERHGTHECAAELHVVPGRHLADQALEHGFRHGHDRGRSREQAGFHDQIGHLALVIPVRLHPRPLFLGHDPVREDRGLISPVTVRAKQDIVGVLDALHGVAGRQIHQYSVARVLLIVAPAVLHGNLLEVLLELILVTLRHLCPSVAATAFRGGSCKRQMFLTPKNAEKLRKCLAYNSRIYNFVNI